MYDNVLIFQLAFALAVFAAGLFAYKPVTRGIKALHDAGLRFCRTMLHFARWLKSPWARLGAVWRVPDRVRALEAGSDDLRGELARRVNVLDSRMAELEGARQGSELNSEPANAELEVPPNTELEVEAKPELEVELDPEPARLHDGEWHPVEESALRAAVAIAAKDDHRHWLNGINVQIGEDGIGTATGSNGAGANVATFAAQRPAESAFSVIVPYEIAKRATSQAGYKLLVAPPDGDWGQCRIEDNERKPVVVSGCIDSKYPDVASMIPEQGTGIAIGSITPADVLARARIDCGEARKHEAAAKLGQADGTYDPAMLLDTDSCELVIGTAQQGQPNTAKRIPDHSVELAVNNSSPFIRALRGYAGPGSVQLELHDGQITMQGKARGRYARYGGEAQVRSAVMRKR